MINQSKRVLISAFSIGWVVLTLPGSLYARGGPGLLGQGVPIQNNFGYSPAGSTSESTSQIDVRMNSGDAAAAYVPPPPASPRWNGGRLSGQPSQRDASGEFKRWGYSISPAYWGIRDPWWYGGFPFWYASFDYASYSNPYYRLNPYDYGYGGFDYGIPIPQTTDPLAPDNDQFFAAARAAFYARDYQTALRNVEHAAIQTPANQDLHELHALVLFALHDYRAAGAVNHAVLNAGSGWDWSVLQSFYPSADVYTDQLRALEQGIRQHGDQAATRFLLASHYLMLGHLNAARYQLEQVGDLEPRDALARNILAGLNSAPSVESPMPRAAVTARRTLGHPPNGVTPTPSPAQLATAVNEDSLLGVWTSHPIPGVTIEATLQPQGHFTWNYKEGSQAQAFSGTFVHHGNGLVFTRDDGGKMDGFATQKGSKGFCFRLNKTERSDPGLTFSKRTF